MSQPGGPLHFHNDTQLKVEYILFGGPTMLTVSKGWLEPGETDEWHRPIGSGPFDCRLVAYSGEHKWRLELSSDDTVRLVKRGELFALVRED